MEGRLLLREEADLCPPLSQATASSLLRAAPTSAAHTGLAAPGEPCEPSPRVSEQPKLSSTECWSPQAGLDHSCPSPGGRRIYVYPSSTFKQLLKAKVA